MSQERGSKHGSADSVGEDTANDMQTNAANDATGAAGDAAARRMAKQGGGAVHDLGEFDNGNKPGTALKGKTEKLKAGDALRLRVHDNQIWGIYGFTVAPPHLVAVESKLIKPMDPHRLGDTNVYEYTLTLAATAKPGDKAHLTSQTAHQSWHDPGWGFSFTMECE
jgi:hypothetical protein